MLQPSLSEYIRKIIMYISVRVSLGFMLQPSLSGDYVATKFISKNIVSLGFMLQPSLSADGIKSVYLRIDVSLGFMLQPSLSVLSSAKDTGGEWGVAGVYAPAFVERLVVDVANICRNKAMSLGFMPQPSLSIWT